MNKKHFFASANTGVGFVMNFDQINTKSGFTYVIKGGSGTGKSTLMKKVGDYFFNKGYDVEFIHCSTDTKSLDGVRICEPNILILDGTSPHVVEANAPGALDKILNVGSFIRDDVATYKTEIQDILSKKSVYYKNLYKLLSSAEKLQQVQKSFCQVDEKQAEIVAQQIFNNLNLPSIERNSESRNMFISAIGENGKTDLISENEFSLVQKQSGNLFFANAVLKKLNQKILQNGYDSICFSDVLSPDYIEGLCVPSINALILFEDEGCQDEFVLFCKNKIDEILSEAGKMISKAKELHQQLEKIYIKHTNFKEIDKMTKKLITEIEDRIKQKI